MLCRLWVALALCVSIQAAEERIWMDAKVDGKAARIFLDTGAGEFFLFRKGADRLGFDLPEAGGSAREWRMYWANDKCRLECIGFAGTLRPAIAEPPGYVFLGDVDGFVGWKMVRKNVLQFDALNLAVSVLPKAPPDMAQWTRLKVRISKPGGWKKWGILALEISPREIVIIDTGSTSGVGLPSETWQKWKAAHPDRPVTLEAVTMPSVGLFAHEQSKARDLRIGAIEMNDIIVEEAEPWSSSMAREKHAATLGLAALKRIDLIIDGKKDIAYLRPKTTPATPYQHNRLGAVFLPRKNDDLIATVMPGTPAADAGIQNGDVLVKIDGVDAALKNPTVGSAPRSTLWQRPAGTHMKLTLRRGDREFEANATLRDLLN